MISKYYFLYIQIIFALIGIIAPLLQPKNLLFGVRLSKGLLKQNEVTTFRKSYLRYSINIFTVWIVVINYLMFKQQWFSSNVIWVEVVILFALYIFFNNRVKNWKSKILQENPELKPENPTVIIDTTFHNEQLTISNKWNLIPGILVLVHLAFCIVYMNFMMENLTIFTDVIKFFITNLILLGAIQWKNFMIRNVKQQISATNPEASRQRTILFRRRWSTYLFIMLTLIIASNLILTLQLLNITTIFDFISMNFYLIFVGAIVFVSILMSIFLGQVGSRIKVVSESETNTDDIDDDKHWKAGFIYYNPSDPSLWIDKRMGIGWTLNFGNKFSWLFIIGIIALVILTNVS